MYKKYLIMVFMSMSKERKVSLVTEKKILSGPPLTHAGPSRPSPPLLMLACCLHIPGGCGGGGGGGGVAVVMATCWRRRGLLLLL